MKFLVSDYDGTLKSDVKNLKINISAIQKFRNEGNYFAIATGRSYESIKGEINKYNIKYDFLITNDGAITFDKFDNIIDYEALSGDILEKMYKTIYNIKKYKNKLNIFKLPNSNKIIELQLITSIFNSLNDLNELISNYPIIYKTDLRVFLFKFTFLKAFCSKSSAIKKIIEKNNIDYQDVITIGDGKNDIEMLNDFNGYKMLYSYPCLLKYNFKTTKEVHTLIKKMKKGAVMK